MISATGGDEDLQQISEGKNGYFTQPTNLNQVVSYEWFWTTLVVFSPIRYHLFGKYFPFRHHSRLLHILRRAGAFTHTSVRQLFRKYIYAFPFTYDAFLLPMGLPKGTTNNRVAIHE